MNAFRMISVVIGSTTPVSGFVTVWATSSLLSRSRSCDQHVAVVVEPGSVPGRDDRRRALLLDHGRPVVGTARLHAVTQQHGRIVLDPGEDHAAASEQRVGAVR